MALYFAQQYHSYYGGWAVDADPDKALSAARRHIGVTAREARKDPSYVLEFPDNADVTVNNADGGWSANVSPIRVERRNNIPADTNLLGNART